MSGRATGVEAIVTLQITLTDRATGEVAVLAQRLPNSANATKSPSTRKPISTRAARPWSGSAASVARSVVSAILENF